VSIQAVAGIVADGRQVVNRACEESRSYKRLVIHLRVLLRLLSLLLDD
jgi:20S proteasome alpha/beta subunit